MKDFFINNAEWIAVVGGVIALVGTILVNVKSRRESLANEKKQEELIELSMKVNSMVTGGDAFPLYSFFDIDPQFGVAQYAINNQSNFPLYLTQVSINDSFNISAVMNEPKNMTETGIPSNLIEPFIKTIELTELMPRNAKLLNTFPFAFADGHSFTLITNARNGTFVQVIIPHKSQKGWILAQRVTIANGNNKVLFEVVPDGFPKELVKW